MVLLTAAVGTLMILACVREMRQKRIPPPAASTSVKMAVRLENAQPADNFRTLFEVPVLFYALASISIATGSVPPWLATGAWLYLALEVLHSIIHCTYNKAYHRLAVFVLSFGLLVGMWVGFFVSLSSKSSA